MKSYKEEVLSTCSECKKGIKLQDVYYLDQTPLCKKCYNELMQLLFEDIDTLDDYFRYGTQAWDY